MDSKTHWEAVYQTKNPDEVSWYQREPRVSLDLIRRVAPDRAARILDVGAGASRLVSRLLSEGYSDVTLLELSARAIEKSQEQTEGSAASVTWLEGDVLTHPLPEAAFDVWHDRAVFHFLTSPADRARYIAQVLHALRPGGHLIVATFDEHGPTKCSGLPVARYAPEALQAEFGPQFEPVEVTREAHTTPSGATQSFMYCVCRLQPDSPAA